MTFPRLIGYQKAFWTLLSSSWLDAETCKKFGLAFEVVDPDQLMTTLYEHAEILAAQPLTSLLATKELLMSQVREELRAAYKRENIVLFDLMGGPANQEAIAAFKERRAPDFSKF